MIDPAELPPPAEVEAVRQAFRTKSDQIRALSRKGYKRARIADALGVRYQFVRNVLKDERPLPGLAEQPSPPFQAPPMVRVGNIYRFEVEPGGKITLPPDILEQFRLAEGRVVVAERIGETLVLLSPSAAWERARAGLRPWREGEPMLSEELIAERKAEAARE